LLKTKLSYDNGTIVVSGMAHVPFASFDPRSKSMRAQAIHYQNIIEYLKQSGISYEDSVLELIPSPTILINNNNIHLTLREYQQKALQNWTKAGKRGCVVLPTGAGKTVIGIKAIEMINGHRFSQNIFQI
jgi:superfamily II DNA or RNA helicase